MNLGPRGLAEKKGPWYKINIPIPNRKVERNGTKTRLKFNTAIIKSYCSLCSSHDNLQQDVNSEGIEQLYPYSTVDGYSSNGSLLGQLCSLLMIFCRQSMFLASPTLKGLHCNFGFAKCPVGHTTWSRRPFSDI